MATVEVNGRTYRTPERPTVVICFDGCDPAYIERGIKDGILPTIAAFRDTGFFALGRGAVPTFTNPNNASIVTGVPPAVHGISGNYYLDRATGEERMITDASLMRCGTILAAMAKAGVKTAAVTAKDKLRLMLARGLEGIAFSSEKADQVTLADNGIARRRGAWSAARKPDQYSADLSLYVLDAGIAAARARRGARCSICRCPTSCSTRMRRATPKPTPSTAPSTSASPRWWRPVPWSAWWPTTA